jgi:Sec-independent protein translocase protein TatA
MKFLNSVFETIKKYWYLFAIGLLTAIVIIVSFVENSKLANLVRLLKHTAEDYRKQVETIDKLADKKSKKDKQATMTYEEKAKLIEQKRQEELAKVNAKKIQVAEDLKDKSADELANKLKEEFKL